MTTKSSKTGRTRTRRRTEDEFDVLWRVLPHPPDSVVRMFCRGGDAREGDFARSAAELRHFALSYPERNVYVAPNPTASTAGMRHSARDVTHWSYLLVDMDPVEKKYDARAALDEALLLLGEWMARDFGPGHEPIIIDSGRGVQAWIRLEDVPLDETLRSHARRVNGYWLKKLDERLGVVNGCRIDTSVSDLPRVMRCPGTINVKTKKMAKFIHATDHQYAGLANLLTVGVPSQVLSDPEPTKDVAPGQPWQMVFPHLTRMSQVYLTQGQEEPGRHQVAWHTAKKLQELGVTRAEAKKALLWANGLKGEEEELPDDQIEHALNTAYGR